MLRIFKNDPSITAVRLVLVFLMTGSALALSGLGVLPVNIARVMTTGLLFLVAAFLLRLADFSKPSWGWDYGQMLVNVLWIFAFLRTTGGADSPFSLLFFLAIMAAANARLAKGAIFTATLSSLAYGLLLFLEYQAQRSSLGPEAVDFFSAFSADFLFRGYIYAICFYLVAAFAGLLAERLQTKGRQLEDTTRAWEEFRLSTGDILERMGSGLMTVSIQGQVKFCNRAGSEILGLESSRAVGSDIRQLLNGGLSPLAEILVNSIEQNISKINRYELNLARNDGSEIPLGISLNAIRGWDGRLQGVIAIFQDLTEAKRIESRLQEAERLENLKEMAQTLLQVVKPALQDIDQAMEIIKGEQHQDQAGFRAAGVLQQKVDLIKKTLADFLRFASIETPELKGRIAQEESGEGIIIGQHQSFLEVLKLVRQVAPTDSTVLITGESGTGKEVIARELHRLSLRSGGPFVSINCAALPETLLESELFGHVRGSFTGAIRDKEGLFRVAEGGTFFLDEVSETSPAIQVKLLRVLQEREVVPVGGSRPIKVDVRLISATNADLLTAVDQGKFRRDLYYRLNVIQIAMPPLRERGQDIIDLAEYFLARSCRKQNRPTKSLSPAAVKALTGYDWPGNVRELENVMERAAVLCKGNIVEIEHLPSEILGMKKPGKTLILSQGTLKEDEKNKIISTLEECGGNKTLTAKKLGIHYATLYRKLKQYGIK